LTYRKWEKQVINYDPSDLGQKKIGKLWSASNKVIGSNVDPP